MTTGARPKQILAETSSLRTCRAPPRRHVGRMCAHSISRLTAAGRRQVRTCRIPPSALCSLCRSLRPTFRAEQVSLLNLDRLPSHGLLFVGCLCAVWHTLQSKPPSRLNDPQAQQRKVPPISRIFTARPDLMHLSPLFGPECRRSITLNSKPVPRTTTTCAHKPTYPKPSRYQPNKLNLSPRFHRVDVPLPGSTCAHKPTSQQPWHVWPCPCSCVCP